jgi:phosphate transport system substrate-binding protein
MTFSFGKAVALAALGVVAMTAQAEARDQIRIVGSSTVFPFATVVAENFGKTTGFKTPVIESTGSGGGLKLFCQGVGTEHPDFTNASRRIKKSEVELCAENGVTDITEIKIGYDGIVLANSKAAETYELTRKQIFMALAKQVPVDGKLVDNPYTKWSQIDPSLPDVEIEVLGPPPTSGTRDAFVELVMREGAEQFPMLEALEKKPFRAVSDSMREDGRFVEAGENDNLIVQKLEANPAALGIFGFSFLDQNADKVHGSVVDGTAPSFDAIADGSYPVSRSLFFYMKNAHVGVIPGMKEYVAEFTSEKAAGQEGYLTDKGLIPLPTADLEGYRTAGENLTNLSL